MSSVRNLTKSDSEIVVRNIAITAIMNMEKRSGKMKPVIQKTLFNLNVNR